MSWFFKRKSLDASTIAKWIGSVQNSGDRAQFHEMRKNVQSGMLNEIMTHVLQPKSERDEQVAYLLIHFYSGRAFLPTFTNTLEAMAEQARLARELFDIWTKPVEGALVSSPVAPTDQFRLTAVYSCSLEVTNEALEQHYLDASLLADHGIRLWPDVGELWRQRGVLRLTQGDYDVALTDLKQAKALRPDMQWLNEPADFAVKQLG